MRFFQELLANRVLWACLISWFTAQALKVVFVALIDKKWDFERFFGLGGMPSSHSSVVCTLTTAIGISRGYYSAEFAVCFILACVVMTDAAGVRRSAGKQAAVLNRIVQDMLAKGVGFKVESLKEMLGHSPFEVMIGALLGVLIGILVM